MCDINCNICPVCVSCVKCDDKKWEVIKYVSVSECSFLVSVMISLKEIR